MFFAKRVVDLSQCSQQSTAVGKTEIKTRWVEDITQQSRRCYQKDLFHIVWRNICRYMPAFNPHVRQLLHVGYKIAAGMDGRYLQALKTHEAAISRNVTQNLYDRHLRPLLLGEAKVKSTSPVTVAATPA